ncbi:hypothetical protein A5761_01765 [Mycolicibacterium setense]|uniref:nitroreductase family deazaflavin-dependent oxidoreductase n=1 Tax=Mycolicibacterium setense TaxID=431269 RepID=UPI0007EB8481|nr:nitroreductase family deazaflavin-dependent oxidoreductase [Mycolicibacterium setense]OBB14651.1 hypothetical protein A5761_01765 [Mycolicibacterium setense]
MSQDAHREAEAATIARYEATDGKEVGGGWAEGLPLIILTTRGRTSGKPRKVALVYVEQDGVYAIVASGPDPLGGSTKYSQWYHNLVADPKVTVRDKGNVFEAVARIASDEEKAAWWPRLTEAWPDYDMYQERTTKIIPVVLLEPISTDAS